MMRVTTSDSAFVSAFGGIRFYQLVPSQYSISAPPCSDNQSDGSHPVSVLLTSNSAPHQYLMYSLCVYAEKRLHWLLLVVCNVCLHSSWMKRTRCLQGFSLITLIIAISSDPRASLVTKLRSHGSLGGLPRRVQATCIRTIRLLSLLSIACASVPFLLCLLMTFLSCITCVLSCLTCSAHSRMSIVDLTQVYVRPVFCLSFPALLRLAVVLRLLRLISPVIHLVGHNSNLTSNISFLTDSHSNIYQIHIYIIYFKC
jgi:hypothetical protein